MLKTVIVPAQQHTLEASSQAELDQLIADRQVQGWQRLTTPEATKQPQTATLFRQTMLVPECSVKWK